MREENFDLIQRPRNKGAKYMRFLSRKYPDTPGTAAVIKGKTAMERIDYPSGSALGMIRDHDGRGHDGDREREM